mgnify:CR=1 FL=1
MAPRAQPALELVVVAGLVDEVGLWVAAQRDCSLSGYAAADDLQALRAEVEQIKTRQIAARAAAKAAKNFAEADRIRNELLTQGIVLKDSPTGTTWERA